MLYQYTCTCLELRTYEEMVMTCEPMTGKVSNSVKMCSVTGQASHTYRGGIARDLLNIFSE